MQLARVCPGGMDEKVRLWWRPLAPAKESHEGAVASDSGGNKPQDRV